MSDMQNPFLYGRPVEHQEELINRASEKAELVDSARTGQPVMVYAPRRYGKTSLARVVANEVITFWEIQAIYVDFWGVVSIADVVNVLGRSYARVSNVFRVRGFLADLLGSMGFKVSLGGGFSVSYQGRATSEDERAALRSLLEVPERLALRASGDRVLLILDEFGEILNVPGEPDALMRSAFQNSPHVSFLFMGSKRSLMDGLFSDRKRPFYNFGRRMELGRLPHEPLGEFIEEKFKAVGRRITEGAMDVLLDQVQGHPYRAQQLAFHTFRLTKEGGVADEETVLSAREEVLKEAEPEFRAILDEMSTPRRAVLVAFCRDPTGQPYSREYMQRHGIKGPGALRSALDALIASGHLERRTPREQPIPTDPLFAFWIRERTNSP
jgi:AAA+ ATPase superfamily predicted ATPase